MRKYGVALGIVCGAAVGLIVSLLTEISCRTRWVAARRWGW